VAPLILSAKVLPRPEIVLSVTDLKAVNAS
jgi:hypothetical protein